MAAMVAEHPMGRRLGSCILPLRLRPERLPGVASADRRDRLQAYVGNTKSLAALVVIRSSTLTSGRDVSAR